MVDLVREKTANKSYMNEENVSFECSLFLL